MMNYQEWKTAGTVCWQNCNLPRPHETKNVAVINRTRIPMIRKHVSLKSYNTFGIDVRAAQFSAFSNADELKACIQRAEYSPWILGGGSNVLFTDDFAHCVLKNEIFGISTIMQNAETQTIRVGAGVNWHNLVTWCMVKDLGGIENLALIPGSVGAAPMQNIGAYGGELKETFVSLRALHLKDGKVHEFTNAACEFGYRDSIFKGKVKDQYCILDIDLRLTKPPHEVNTEYGTIRDELIRQGIASPTIRDVFHTVIAIRRSKLADPLVLGNAGSFFKNPVIDERLYQTLIVEFPRMPSYFVDVNQYKIPAGWLIEQCGWKGKRVGNVGCYEKQALVIVNYGGASGREVYDHAMRVKESVQERFGIELMTEVNVF